jgi:serine/threonine protein kinase
MHSKKLLHRDLSARNILVDENSGVMLVDLG